MKKCYHDIGTVTDSKGMRVKLANAVSSERNVHIFICIYLHFPSIIEASEGYQHVSTSRSLRTHQSKLCDEQKGSETLLLPTIYLYIHVDTYIDIYTYI